MFTREHRQFHWRIAAAMTITMGFVFLGATLQGGLASDNAYTATIFCLLGITAWVVRWAKCSSVVRYLLIGSVVCVIAAQLVDISENFAALADIPVLGANSIWNGRVNSTGFTTGQVLIFSALLVALVEARVERERYRLLADHVSDVIAVSDFDLSTLYLSPSVERLLGCTTDQALARPLHESLTPESLEDAKRTIEAELAHSRSGARRLSDATIRELEFIQYGGSRVWAEVSMSFLPAKDGTPGCLLTVTRDITARKAVERSLQRSELKYRSLVENAPVAIHEMDHKGRIQSLNPAGLRMLGFIDEHAALGASYADIADEPHRRRLRNAIRRSSRGSEVRCTFDGSAWGSMRRFIAHLAPVRPGAASQGQLVGITLDTTERVATEDARRVLEQQLHQAQKLDSIGRLAGGIAHDFNNMLQVIMGYAEMDIELESESDCSDYRLLEIRGAAERAADLTSQLLTFARKNSGTPQIMTLNSWVDPTASFLRRLIGEHIRLNVSVARELWPVRIDPSQMDQVLTNLCVNARDAISGSGSITIGLSNISVNAEQADAFPDTVPGDYVELRVSDDGCGIDERTMERIFEPFYTSKEKDKGTGLGLSTVYGIVRQSRGHIAVDSVPGVGTTVRVRVPRYRGTQQIRNSSVTSSRPIRGSELVLIVEDDPSVLSLVQMMLQNLGYHVLAAAGPGEATRLVETYRGRIDLLLTDLIMPDMNGRELAISLQARIPGLRHLLMSGYAADVVDRERLKRDGFKFIQKPFRAFDLAEAIRTVLDATPGSVERN